jgi:hypothetical protein
MTPAIQSRVATVYAADAIVETGLEADRKPGILARRAS